MFVVAAADQVSLSGRATRALQVTHNIGPTGHPPKQNKHSFLGLLGSACARMMLDACQNPATQPPPALPMMHYVYATQKYCFKKPTLNHSKHA